MIRRVLPRVAAVALLALLFGCGAVRHLHPNTGRATRRVFKRQAHKPPPAQLAEVSGEEAEIILGNLREQSKASEKSDAPKTVLLPLQR